MSLFRPNRVGSALCRGKDVSSEPLLEFCDVSRSFVVRRGVLGRSGGEVRAVDRVSLTVRKGETLGLVGESGCGKSTLGRMAVCLLPPSSGEVRFKGETVCAPASPGKGNTPAGETRGRLQMIFQDPFSSLNPRLPIGASVSEPLLAEGLPATERKARVADMLAGVGLAPEHAARYPHEFSGGQRQRIAIARALITHPDLVVCDEAVSALDASIQAQVLNLLKDARDAFGPAYLFISHDLGVVGHMSDRIAVMYLGRIVEQAPCQTLFSAAAHPYTQALLAAAPSLENPERGGRSFLSGELPSPFAPPPGCAFHPRCPRALPRCREEAPSMRELAPEHTVCCHLY